MAAWKGRGSFVDLIGLEGRRRRGTRRARAPLRARRPRRAARVRVRHRQLVRRARLQPHRDDPRDAPSRLRRQGRCSGRWAPTRGASASSTPSRAISSRRSRARWATRPARSSATRSSTRAGSTSRSRRSARTPCTPPAGIFDRGRQARDHAGRARIVRKIRGLGARRAARDAAPAGRHRARSARTGARTNIVHWDGSTDSLRIPYSGTSPLRAAVIDPGAARARSTRTRRTTSRRRPDRRVAAHRGRSSARRTGPQLLLGAVAP